MVAGARTDDDRPLDPLRRSATHDDDPGRDENGPGGVTRDEGDDLSRRQVGWRVGAVGLGLAVLLSAQVADTNDWFPLGSLSQYATPRPADGSVVTTSLEGTTVDGEVVRVPLSPSAIGMSRAEVESQGQRIISDPDLLGVLARSRAELHPEAPVLTQLRLVRSERRLSDAQVVGPVDVRILASWDAEAQPGESGSGSTAAVGTTR